MFGLRDYVTTLFLSPTPAGYTQLPAAWPLRFHLVSVLMRAPRRPARCASTLTVGQHAVRAARLGRVHEFPCQHELDCKN